MTDHPTAPHARELTDEEAAARVDNAQLLQQGLIEALSRGRAALWMAAEQLYLMDEDACWSALGYETKAEWLAQPEIGLAYSTYQNMVTAWRQLVIRRKVTMDQLRLIDISKATIVLPAVISGRKKLADALSDAESLGQRDLRTEYQGARPVESPPLIDQTDHEPEVPINDGSNVPVYAVEVIDAEGEPVVIDEVVHSAGEPVAEEAVVPSTLAEALRLAEAAIADDPSPTPFRRALVRLTEAVRAAGIAGGDR